MKRFYHGANMPFGKIDLSRSRLRTDFGKGFYMGTNLGVARRWAASQAMVHETATVMRYVLNDVVFDLKDNSLKRLWFSTPSAEWLDFVRDNRRIFSAKSCNKEPRHDYDIVYGPVADDMVVDVVDEYIDGLLTVDEAIRRVKVIPSVYQMSFHTALSLSFVEQTLTEYQQQIKGSKWSDWSNV